MKVLLVNGSGHAKGCTYTALEEVAGALEKNGIETEIIQVGTQPIAGCICFRYDHFLPGQSILRQERPVPGQARCLHRQLQTRWGFRSL